MLFASTALKNYYDKLCILPGLTEVKWKRGLKIDIEVALFLFEDLKNT